MTLTTAFACAAFLCLLFAGSALRAQTTEEAKSNSWDEAWAKLFRREAPDFADFENEDQARAVLVKGISSDDREVLEHTLRQIGFIAMLGSMEDMMPDMGDDFATPQLGSLGRRFSTAPGLRGHLIEYAKKSGHQAKRRIESGVEYASLSDTERQPFETWSMTMYALAAYFPQDSVVHDFLIDSWLRGDLDRSMAVFLYVGRFRSEAADEIYIAALEGEGPGVALVAAKGVALSGSDAGLVALVKSLDRRDIALETVVQAIATFGERAKPHFDSLIDLRKELEEHVADMDDPWALHSFRKRSINDTIAGLITQYENVAGD